MKRYEYEVQIIKRDRKGTPRSLLGGEAVYPIRGEARFKFVSELDGYTNVLATNMEKAVRDAGEEITTN